MTYSCPRTTFRHPVRFTMKHQCPHIILCSYMRCPTCAQCQTIPKSRMGNVAPAPPVLTRKPMPSRTVSYATHGRRMSHIVSMPLMTPPSIGSHYEMRALDKNSSMLTSTRAAQVLSHSSRRKKSKAVPSCSDEGIAPCRSTD
jgi:hypothetical protein